MTRTRSGRVWACAVVLIAFAAGCGDEPCKKGQTECISDALIRTCVEGEDENEWFVHDCGDDSRCGAPSAAGAAGGAGSMAAPASDTAVCVGNCEAGSSECVAEAVARYCVDGRAWQLDPCGAGQLCVDGMCRFADGGVQLCEPGARSCGSEQVEKVCDRDGSKWIEQPCDDGEQCLVDRCAPDPDASCDVPSRCLDNKTALRCLGEAQGFEVVACEGETFCEEGGCRGAVCALGSLCAPDNQIVECVDGESLRTTQCAVNEACRQERDVARCVPRPCEPGIVRCGDPRDDSVDPQRFYSQCRPGAETESGLPEWVVGECTGLLTCDPARALTGSPCQQECTPGAQSCVLNVAFGIADGWAECQDDGTWGPVTSCNAGGGLRRQCVIEPTFEASALPVALCAQPVCAYVIESQDGVGGACTSGRLQPCGADGELAAAEACEVGICRATALEAQADGRVPGACDTEVECETGEERCLIDDLVPTTLYQTCENGLWTARLTTCADDGLCLDYLDADGLRRKVCGADCTPGEKRCNISDQVQVCDDEGHWGTAQSCDVGVCATIGTQPGQRDAACVLECVPGEVACTGVEVAASDGVSAGLSQEAVCSSEGLLGTPTTCAAGTACRVSGAGSALGCVECLGPDALGGNEWGYMDTRCDPGTPANVQQCGADNTWDASRACSADKTCHMVNGASCGQCTVNTTLMTCSQTNVAMQQRCGPCQDASLGLTPIASCRNSAIVSLTAATTMETCESLFGDGPAAPALSGAVGTTSWGGVTDCCDGASPTGTDGEFLQYYDCESRGLGAPTVAGGVSDCCGLYVTPGLGAAFAYCASAL